MDEEWRYQITHVVKSADDLSKIVNLSDEEREAIDKVTPFFKMSITPYYATLMDKDDVNCPIRKMIIPNTQELECVIEPNLDKENAFEELPGFRQEYADKCTILLTYVCPNYCRYCFRKYWVGRDNRTLSYEQIDAITKKINSDKAIIEVCISGGEPLIVDDDKIGYLLEKISEIPHVKVVRLFTRSLVFMPQRITKNLCDTLKKYPTLYVCTHFNHPKELTPLSKSACLMLINSGIPVLNQTVLLKGINDSAEIMRELLWQLVQIKVKPLYLYHCINTMGNHHLVTPISLGTDIIKELYNNMSALAIPLYIASLYDGKVLLMPDYYLYDEHGKKYFLSKKNEKYYVEDME